MHGEGNVIPLAGIDLTAAGEGPPLSTWDSMTAPMRLAAKSIRAFLEDPGVIEIMCNRPGEIFTEKVGVEYMQRYEIPELTREAIEELAYRVAASSNQYVSSESPLLSAAMQNGERFQAVLYPAAYDGGAFSIRKKVIKNMTLEDYLERGGFDHVRVTGPTHEVPREALTPEDIELNDILRDDTPRGRLKALAFCFENRLTSAISGGTSSGKTTLFNAALKKIPSWERFTTIEDTPELDPEQPNRVRLIASKGDQGRAKVTVQNLLEAVLRMRPDRLYLGEIRGAEAFTFLQGVNTGHPGSCATLHADHPYGAYQRIAMAALAAGMNMSHSDLVVFAREVVPVMFQVNRLANGTRRMTEIYYSKLLRR